MADLAVDEGAINVIDKELISKDLIKNMNVPQVVYYINNSMCYCVTVILYSNIVTKCNHHYENFINIK